MTDREEDKIQDQEADSPCEPCGQDPAGCGGCGAGRKRTDTLWYIIAALAILLIAILIGKSGGSGT